MTTTTGHRARTLGVRLRCGDMTLTASPKESTITTNIIKYLRSLPTAHARKVFSGGMGNNGEPDIDACVAGRSIKIEVKRSASDHPTPLQRVQLDKWERAGALAFVARSVEDVQARLHAEGLV